MNCVICGKPATKRIGPDLVEPDSGIPPCDDQTCKEEWMIGLLIESAKLDQEKKNDKTERH